MPLTISPHDHNTVYVGSQHVHQTTNGGQSWQVISPDLTTQRQDPPADLRRPDAATTSASSTPSSCIAIAESRLESGPDLGRHQRRPGAGHARRRQDLDQRHDEHPDLPPWGTVSNIEPSRYDAGTAYLTVDLHQVNNRDPYVYKTTDYGRTGQLITNGIPKSMLSYAHCISEDPVRRGLLYLGTENAIYVSFDDGENWQPLQTNLPHAPVYWITVQEHFNDLVVATYGRGFWILDDLTPLQQLTPQVAGGGRAPLPAASGVSLPRHHRARRRLANDPTAGENPPYGASINYYLKSAPTERRRPSRSSIRRDTSCGAPGAEGRGLNRVYWDLRYEPTKEIRLRTSPLYAPDIARRARRHAARAGRGPPVDPRAAGNLHRKAERRGQTAHAEARGAQGSELGRDRRRHSAADEGARSRCGATSITRPT